MLKKFEILLNKKNIALLLLIPYLVIVFITAWLSDDSYITFRTIDNFINGFGLTWNVTERVQSYTHPLWMFLLSGFYFFTRDIYYTSLIVSILISLAAVYLLLKSASSIVSAIITVLTLVFSKAFIDFSTSGLENPLTHLLLIIFFISYFKLKEGSKKLFILSLISSFIALNRIDILLICIPVLLTSYFKVNKVKGLLRVFYGFLPLILWEIFSLFYYGFLIPNTAYAKLNTGIDHLQLFQQGLHYFVFSFYLDPLTPVIILLGLVMPFIIKDRKFITISIGILFYLFYIIYIGGDFMNGRFLAAPFLCSVFIISRFELNKKSLAPIALFIILLGFLSPQPTVLISQEYTYGQNHFQAFRFGHLLIGGYHGIVDERTFYYPYTSLMNDISDNMLYDHMWVKEAFKIKNESQKVFVKSCIGFLGFFSGSNIYILDNLALSEPLLSKLPCKDKNLFDESNSSETKWRIGHFTREIPEGYEETIISGINQIKDPDLHKYYDKLAIVIKGNLWDMNRLKEIWNLNVGKYNYLLDNYNKNLFQ